MYSTNVYVSILLRTTETHQVQFFIEAVDVKYYQNGTVSAGNDVMLNLPRSVVVASHDDQNKGIFLTTSSDKVTVIAQSLSAHI